MRFWILDYLFPRETEKRASGWYGDYEFRNGWLVFGRFIPCYPEWEEA